MKFVFPNNSYKDKAIEFINEFYEYNSDINGSGALDRYLKNKLSYESWIEKVRADIDIANIENGRVPALTYFYVDDSDNIIGMINVRLALNDFLKKEGGHIGYCIRPTERKKGYATQMLRGALKFCKTIRLSEVIVTCDKINIASAKVIRNCGGKLDKEFYSDTFKEVIQRYLIV